MKLPQSVLSEARVVYYYYCAQLVSNERVVNTISLVRCALKAFVSVILAYHT